MNQEAAYHELVESLGDACLIVDMDGTVLAANGLASDLYRRDERELTGASISRLCDAGEAESVMAEISACNGRPRTFHALQQRGDGSSFVGEFSAKARHEPSRESVLLIVRESQMSDGPLVQDLTLRTMMLNHVSDGLVCHTPEGRLLFANRAALDSWGVKELHEARALGPFGWVAEEQRERLADLMHRMVAEGELSFESHGHAPSGEPIHLEIRSTVIHTEDGVFVVSATRDISERMQTEEMVRYLAYHDTLTGLGNRVLLESDLEHAIAVSRRSEECVGLIYLDLDNFKPVNDTYGHAIGDQVLREVANRLAECVREGDTVARPGGDEFVVVIPRLKKPKDLAVVAQKLVERVADAITVDGVTVTVNASVGLAICANDENAEQLLTRADLAMYDARYSGEAGWKNFSLAETD